MAPRTGRWREVRKANPDLTDEELDELLDRAIEQERQLVLKHKLNFDQAREIVRQQLFPDETDATECEPDSSTPSMPPATPAPCPTPSTPQRRVPKAVLDRIDGKLDQTFKQVLAERYPDKVK